jgi:hypothetical protein
VFGVPDEPLRAYLAEANYVSLSEGVWRTPERISDGCQISIR